MATCGYCGNQFQPREKRSSKFCSRSCSNTFSNRNRKHTQQTKDRIREANEKNGTLVDSDPERHRKMIEASQQAAMNRREDRPCQHCGVVFKACASDGRKYCSEECRKHYVGGVRKGAGRSRSGWFSGVWCDSTYELAFLIWCLDQGRKIERCADSFPYVDEDGTCRTYHPDFVVDGQLYEIKGFLRERDSYKHAAVDVIVIEGKESNRPYLEHASLKHGLSFDKLHRLYGKPEKYAHTCCECGVNFDSTKEKRAYCSRSCAGKARAKAKWSPVSESNRCYLCERETVYH